VKIHVRLQDDELIFEEADSLFTPLFWKKVGLSFARAFIPVFFLGLGGVYDAVSSGDVSAAKSALIALAVAAGAAALRAAQALFTTLETPPDNQ
jgi:hypothetical protein